MSMVLTTFVLVMTGASSANEPYSENKIRNQNYGLNHQKPADSACGFQVSMNSLRENYFHLQLVEGQLPARMSIFKIFTEMMMAGHKCLRGKM